MFEWQQFTRGSGEVPMQCVWCQETTVATSGCRSFGDTARGGWSLLWVSEGRWRASIATTVATATVAESWATAAKGLAAAATAGRGDGSLCGVSNRRHKAKLRGVTVVVTVARRNQRLFTCWALTAVKFVCWTQD